MHFTRIAAPSSAPDLLHWVTVNGSCSHGITDNGRLGFHLAVPYLLLYLLTETWHRCRRAAGYIVG